MSSRTETALARIRRACLAVAVCATFVPTARAEEPAAKRARALFAEGRELAADGRYAEACPKLVESYKLVNGVGTAFNLADCWEHVGRTELARSIFLDVADRTRNAGQTQRAAAASARAKALAEAPAAPPEAPPVVEPTPTSAVVQLPEVVVTPPTPVPLARANDAEERAATLPVRLRDEYSQLADAALQLQALRKSLAELAPSPADAAHARALAQQLADAERELHASWQLAGQVAAQALRRSAWSQSAHHTAAPTAPPVTRASAEPRSAVASQR